MGTLMPPQLRLTRENKVLKVCISKCGDPFYLLFYNTTTTSLQACQVRPFPLASSD
jgi:hypothetical protein